jgi:uncharacterized protein (TIRG00374 family)
VPEPTTPPPARSRARHARWRPALLGLVVVGLGATVAWRGPGVAQSVLDGLKSVRWGWALAAVLANVVSLLLRGVSWAVVLKPALPTPPATTPTVSAYAVGQLGNVVLPARLGEAAKVSLLGRRVPDAGWARLAGSVAAHRLLDALPLAALTIVLLALAGLPGWAAPTIVAGVAGGVLALILAALLARRLPRAPETAGRIRAAIEAARGGFAVLRAPLWALGAFGVHAVSWLASVAAAWLGLRAFGLDTPISASLLVVLATAAALALPLWPGNVGLLQVAVALALVPYGVPKSQGFAAGIGLQAIETLAAVLPGLVALAAEGISLTVLRRGVPSDTPAASAPWSVRRLAGVRPAALALWFRASRLAVRARVAVGRVAERGLVSPVTLAWSRARGRP